MSASAEAGPRWQVSGAPGVMEYVDISALAGKPPGTLVVYALVNPPDVFSRRDGLLVAGPGEVAS